jgi:hypothetical protein
MGKRSKVMKAGDYGGEFGRYEEPNPTLVGNLDWFGKTVFSGVQNAAHGVGRAAYDAASETRLMPDSSIAVDRKVFAKYGNKNWYPAVITKKNTDGTYEVKYTRDNYREKLNKDSIRLLFPDYPTDQTNTNDSRVANRLSLYNHIIVTNNGVVLNKDTSTYKELKPEVQNELHRIINGGYLFGGKTRKQRKSNKHNKSQKNRKSRKDRK